MTQALIYRRFSTDEQEFGSSDTLSRQLERCQDMAKAKAWTVTEVLTDKGRSAYKREHLLPDAELGKFMTRLRSGEFAKGTILIADNLSRLSRRPVDEALAWIYEINAAGITIALADKSEVHRANPDMAEIIARTLNLGAAHKSSQEKSEMTLLSKARLWKSAEARTGKWVNLANRPPSWLVRKPTLDGFDIIKERADVVRMGEFLTEEEERLDNWREDAKVSYDNQIKAAQKEAKEKAKLARATQNLQEKIALQKEQAALKRQADDLQHQLYLRLGEIDDERNRMLDDIAEKLNLTPTFTPLFTARWTLAE